MLAVVFLYIVGGLAYTVGYKKYDGRERIPNAKLWGELPGLVKVNNYIVSNKTTKVNNY